MNKIITSVKEEKEIELSELDKLYKEIEQSKLKLELYEKELKEKEERSKNGIKSKGKERRPLELEEYHQIINLLNNGFIYYDKHRGKDKIFKPQKAVALALILEANVGIRISDVVNLTVKELKEGRVNIREKKTNKLQYKKINKSLQELIVDYALENNLKLTDKAVNGVSIRKIQRDLKFVSDHLGLTSIGTHSFRKLFAMTVYEKTRDIELLRVMLNHSSSTVTQKYLSLRQNDIDEVSQAIDFTKI